MKNRMLQSLIGVLALVVGLAHAGPGGVTVETLLEADMTILGQGFSYPEGTPKITMAVVTVPPHATIALHEHPVPLAVYILQGEIVVDYEGIGEIRYKKGDSFVEAFNVPHSAYNGGRGKVLILTVYAGADGVPNAVPK